MKKNKLEDTNQENFSHPKLLFRIYPNLKSYWQEIGVPTTPFGDENLMHEKILSIVNQLLVFQYLSLVAKLIGASTHLL
jgi:hypothetical protein